LNAEPDAFAALPGSLGAVLERHVAPGCPFVPGLAARTTPVDETSKQKPIVNEELRDFNIVNSLRYAGSSN